MFAPHAQPSTARPSLLRPRYVLAFALPLLGMFSALGCSDTGDAPLDEGSDGLVGDGGSTSGSTTAGGAGGGPSAGAANRPATGGTGGGGGAAVTPGGSSGPASGGQGGSPTMDDSEALDAQLGAGETGIFVGMTAEHNALRRELDLPDLRWSDDLALVAQDWSDTLASQCGTIEHRMPNDFGENIAMRSSRGSFAPFSAAEAFEGWAAEVDCWGYGSIRGTETCDPQCIAALNSTGCGHYTQLVWEDTERVGCGYSTCELSGSLVEIWVCNYDPPGNYIGQEPY